MSNPAILPPSNNTVEPVICPDDFKIRLSFELEIVVASIEYPPIAPASAVILPTICAAEAEICPFDLSIRLSLTEFI